LLLLDHVQPSVLVAVVHVCLVSCQTIQYDDPLKKEHEKMRDGEDLTPLVHLSVSFHSFHASHFTHFMHLSVSFQYFAT